MIKQITKTTKLHKTEYTSVKKLVDIAAVQDKYKIKLYWNILQNRQTQEFNDFFYYVDGNLVGYLALFTFKLDEAEVSAVVHPKFRRQKIFKQLLEEAQLELKKRNISRCLFICHQSSKSLIEYFKNSNAHYVYSQVEMHTTKEPIIKSLPEIQLRLATADDVALMAKLGSTSFDTPFLEVLQRFLENLRDKNRKAWLLIVNDEYIGKIHVRFEDSRTAFIHDLCILPDYRGKKYATAMILKTMDILRHEGYKHFTLDVECHNEGALKLYEQCGFEVVSAYDFWRHTGGF
jgi:ribosomal protein S18 acetylase RimI-like enzyme